MTKYILAGGCDRLYPDYGKRLAEVILRENSNPVILSCMFSLSEGDREHRHAYFDRWFKENFGQNARIIRAIESDFYDQLNRSDVLYLHGGTTKRLLGALPDFSKFRQAVQNKIIIGSSAGANYLSSVCYSPSSDEVMRGSEILNVGVVVHYGIEKFDEKQYEHTQWLETAKKIKEAAGDALTILLPEGNFVVIDT